VGLDLNDATVEVENINRNREAEPNKDMDTVVLDSASQIATPAFVSTLSICIVFAPMFLLSGVARYLFVPLAEAVVFAMLASYFLSRTIVPTMAKYLLRGEKHDAGAPSRNPLVRLQKRFEEAFEKFHHHERAAFVLAVIENVNDVFVLQPRRGARLLEDLGAGFQCGAQLVPLDVLLPDLEALHPE